VDVLEINQDVTSVLAFKFEVVQQYYATLFKIGGGGGMVFTLKIRKHRKQSQ